MWTVVSDSKSNNIQTYPEQDSFGAVKVPHEINNRYVVVKTPICCVFNRVLHHQYKIVLAEGSACTCDVIVYFRQPDKYPEAHPVRLILDAPAKTAIGSGWMEIKTKPGQAFYLPNLEPDHSIQIVHNSWDGRELGEDDPLTIRRRSLRS